MKFYIEQMKRLNQKVLVLFLVRIFCLLLFASYMSLLLHDINSFHHLCVIKHSILMPMCLPCLLDLLHISFC